MMSAKQVEPLLSIHRTAQRPTMTADVGSHNNGIGSRWLHM